MFNMERSSFLYISLIQIMEKESNFPFIAFFIFFLSRITRFYAN